MPKPFQRPKPPTADPELLHLKYPQPAHPPTPNQNFQLKLQTPDINWFFGMGQGGHMGPGGGGDEEEEDKEEEKEKIVMMLMLQ